MSLCPRRVWFDPRCTLICPHTGNTYSTSGAWDPEEEKVLQLLIKDGYPIKYAAEVLDRSYGAVHMKATTMSKKGLLSLEGVRIPVREHIPVLTYLSHPEFKNAG